MISQITLFCLFVVVAVVVGFLFKHMYQDNRKTGNAYTNSSCEKKSQFFHFIMGYFNNGKRQPGMPTLFNDLVTEKSATVTNYVKWLA